MPDTAKHERLLCICMGRPGRTHSEQVAGLLSKAQCLHVWHGMPGDWFCNLMLLVAAAAALVHQG